MVKRTVVESDASDEESYHKSSTPAKRARVESEDRDEVMAETEAEAAAMVEEEEAEEDDAGNASPIRGAKAKRKAKGKGKGKGKQAAAVVEDGEDGDDGDEEEELDARLNASRLGNEQDDADFEARNEAAVMDAISRREKKKGGIAKMGIIESIEMHQFMCHPRLSFKFGPQINFIIGHNGSGKSAVLSALTIALGGKAIFTGRGSGLRSFIREGQGVAEVTVGIKNQGDDAYKQDLYGKTIYVTRRFTKEGSSAYKIKSADGKIVSTKREELAAICDHMNIQVDNPMNILTQDAARQFLSGSHPTDKYQFFLKGTQLTQLSEEYETCLENIQKTARTLQLKREEVPELEKAFREAEARNEEADKAREKKTQLAEFKRELAWAHVKEKEKEMTEKFGEVLKEKKRLTKIEENIVKEAEAVDQAGLKIAELNAEHDAIPGIDVVKGKRDDLAKRIKRNKDEILECKASEREMNEQMTMLRGRIKGLDEDIVKETAKLQSNFQEQREEAQRKLQAAEEECSAGEGELRSLEDRAREVRTQLQKDDAQGKRADGAVSGMRREIENSISNIERCKTQSRDDISMFGKNMPAVLAQIQNERWVGHPPVGPFGRYVALKDSKWAEVMRTQLGQSMTSFAVTDNRDRHQLRRILDQHGNNHMQIVVSDVDLFDYSRGEPPERFLTVLRALDIKDEFVKRILINMRSIEKVLLANSRAEGDQLLLEMGGGGFAWGLDLVVARRYGEGGATTSHMNRLAHNDPRRHMFVGADRSADIRRYENEKREAESRLQEAMDTVAACRSRYRDNDAELKRVDAQVQRLRRRHDDLKSQIIRLKGEVLDDAPIGIASLEQAKEEAKDEQKSIETQFEAVVQRRLGLDAENLPLVQNRNELDGQISEWQTRDSEMTEKLTAAMRDRVTTMAHKKHWEDKLADEKGKIDELEKAAEILQIEFTNWSAMAEKIGSRFENPRKPQVIQKQVASVEKALQQHERRQGATPEEIAVERDNAKYALDNHLRQLNEVTKLNKALKTSLATRMGKWHSFRMHIALRCKHQFQHHLFTRGYFGKVIFDHNNGTLNLKVQTDDQASTQSKDKDPKSLSGGEKSYATICLLLALWESIQCPIRCLDEFDVFMDSVNRRISMKMMVDTANTSDKQYILITPQDMSHVSLGPSVRVHRMNDPERNQRSLQF